MSDRSLAGRVAIVTGDARRIKGAVEFLALARRGLDPPRT